MPIFFRRFAPSLLALLLLVAPACATGPVTLLHTNDAYRIVSDKDGNGGAARLATVIDRLRTEHPSAPLILSGDFLSPDIMSGVFHGEQMVDVMNAARFDFVTLGNHEFDQGEANIAARNAQSNFVWIVSNVTKGGKPYPGTVRSKIVTINGVRVGFFGLVTPETKTLARTDDDTLFADPIPVAKAMVVELRKGGAEMIVALTHLLWEQDRELSAAVPAIDVILGGHDHDRGVATEGRVVTVKAGLDWEAVGVVTLVPGGKAEVAFVPVDAAVTEEPRMKKVVAKWEDKLDGALNVPIGTATVPLDATTVANRSGETNLADLVADAMRDSLGTDVAIQNGGGIRSDATYGPGVITKKDVYSILPFGNVVVSVRLKGSDLLEILEHGVARAEEMEGSLAQVGGMTYRATLARPAGERILSAAVGGKPLDPSATYSVATIDYLLEGGGGFAMFANGEVIVGPEYGTTQAETVIGYIEKRGTLAATVDGRVVIDR